MTGVMSSFHSGYFKVSEIRKAVQYLPVDVEVGVSGSLSVVEAVFVLRSCCPRGVRGRRGHNHEERQVVGFILEEVQRHVGLREREI